MFDSLNLKHNTIFRPLKDYLISEALEKRGVAFDSKQIKGRYGYVWLSHFHYFAISLQIIGASAAKLL